MLDLAVRSSSRSPLAWLAALLALAPAGCREEGPLALDELDDPVLQVSWYHGSLGQPLALPHFYVQVSPRHDEDECPALHSDVRAMVGGEVLSVISLGGRVTDPDGRERCTVPTFVLPGEQVNAYAHEETTAIELDDGASTFGVVARGLFVERRASLVEPAGAELHAGEPAVVAWEPATDALGLVGVFFHPGTAPDGPPAFTRSGAGLELDGDRIGFRVPDLAAGPGVLRVEASAAVPTEACRGFRRCDVGVLAVVRELDVAVR